MLDVDPPRVDEYLASRCAGGYSSFRTWTRLARLLELLAEGGAPLSPAPATAGVVTLSGTDALLAGYERFLREERGLASSSTAMYLLRARRFLAGYTEDGNLRAVSPATVSGAVLHEAETLSVASARVFAIALRWLRAPDRADRHGPVRGGLARHVSAAFVVAARRESGPGDRVAAFV